MTGFVGVLIHSFNLGSDAFTGLAVACTCL
jgi:hypothetical protein